MKRGIALCLFFAPVLWTCFCRSDSPAADAARLARIELLSVPPFSESNADGFWRTADAAGLGLNTDALRAHIALCEDTNACSQIVVSQDRIVSEWYSPRYREPLGAMSSTKAVTSLLVGILRDRGRIASLDEKATSYLPEWTGGFREEVTIRHLLTHTAGLARESEPGKSVGYADDKTGFVLRCRPSRRPGEAYAYSNEGAQLFEPIISRAAGMDAAAFADAWLFRPLGMAETKLKLDGRGRAWTYADMQTTARDLARLGVLMLRGGVWADQRVVSAEYIAQATTPSPRNHEMGFFWWIFPGGAPVRGFYASGYLNTDVYVFPEAEIVIVRTQSPKGRFTGRPESAGYREKALPLFAKIAASADGGRERRSPRPLPLPRHCSPSPSPSSATDQTSFEKARRRKF